MFGFVNPKTGNPLTRNGGNLVDISDASYTIPIVDDVPRFVESDNYAKTFGFQWNCHAKTQLDSHTGFPLSKDRLERCLGASLDNLEDKNILEAGCGAGRFTELLVNTGANTHSFDYSDAVTANSQNIGECKNFSLAQANIYEMPYPDNSFDVVICLGVLQHLPSPEKGLKALWQKVNPGGVLLFDHYELTLSSVTKLSIVYRAILKHLPPHMAKRITDFLCQVFFPIHWWVRKVFPLQALLSRISPCLFYYRKFPQLSKSQHLEWTILDTCDHLTDYYKHLRTKTQVVNLVKSLDPNNYDVWRGGNGIEGRCQKTQTSN
jgi:2-polyprenyl-3-methyl-5-hydroxy-6-metoxy-1,4-benzoquinol methylase